MNEEPQQGSGKLTVIAAGLLLVALAAPCAFPNRILAACSLVVALFAAGSILYTGYWAFCLAIVAMSSQVTQRVTLLSF